MHAGVGPKKTGKERPKGLKWIVVLQKFGNEVRVQPDWRKAMEIGDTVQFISADGDVHVEFEPGDGFGANGRPTKLIPLAVQKSGTSAHHKVENSVRGVMQCSIVTPTGVIGYEAVEDKPGIKKPEGTRYCTGGAC
jgi:hypothetical protein